MTMTAPNQLQVIAQPDERYESYCRGCDFIREHIFPGGHLPSMGAMVEAARGTQVCVTTAAWNTSLAASRLSVLVLLQSCRA